MASTKPINRMTLFKIPNPTDQDKLLSQYQILRTNAKKDGKPYILALRAGRAFPDQRAQGYTIAVMTTFASKEDFDYYDTECETHKELKAVAKGMYEGIFMVYFESVFD